MSISKLNNGKWRVQVFNKRTGERPSKTFNTKKEALMWEADWYSSHVGEQVDFNTAMHNYLAERNNILSPATLRNYESYSQYVDFGDIPTDNITERLLQDWVNHLAKTLKPKTVKNVYGFIHAVIINVCPQKRFKIVLPIVYPANLYMPSKSEIKALTAIVAGTDWETPVMLGLCGMRRGEIVALEMQNVHDGWVYVERSLARTKGKWVVKYPKNKNSCRKVPVPRYLTDKIKKDGIVCRLTPNTVSDKFPDLLEKNNIHKFRFHDLRAFFASEQHALGIPEHYTMVAGGWSNIQTMRKIYTRSISEVESMSESVWMQFMSDINGKSTAT